MSEQPQGPKVYPAIPLPETKFELPELTKAEILALKSMASGTANADQQVTSMRVIVEKFADYYGVCVDPAKMQVHAGRRVVGICIVQTISANLK